MTTNAGTNPPDSGSSFSRRRLLRFTGVAGAAAMVSACAESAVPEPQAGSTPTLVTAPKPQSVVVAPPAPIPAPAPMSASASLLCRDSWGARPAKPRGPDGLPRSQDETTITRMTIHHTAVVLGDNSNIIDRLRQHQRYHMDDKGWIDIAYHMAVDRNGNIFQLRDWHLAGDTATSYNPYGHFLVVCEGNFDEEPVSQKQLQGAALAFAWATQNFTISSTLEGHQQVAPGTSCPGASLQAHVTSGDLQRRINALVQAGPVDLPWVCDQQANEQVAAILAGS